MSMVPILHQERQAGFSALFGPHCPQLLPPAKALRHRRRVQLVLHRGTKANQLVPMPEHLPQVQLRRAGVPRSGENGWSAASQEYAGQKKIGASDESNKCCEDETWQSNCEHSDRSNQKEGDGSP